MAPDRPILWTGKSLIRRRLFTVYVQRKPGYLYIVVLLIDTWVKIAKILIWIRATQLVTNATQRCHSVKSAPVLFCRFRYFIIFLKPFLKNGITKEGLNLTFAVCRTLFIRHVTFRHTYICTGKTFYSHILGLARPRRSSDHHIRLSAYYFGLDFWMETWGKNISRIFFPINLYDINVFLYFYMQSQLLIAFE